MFSSNVRLPEGKRDKMRTPSVKELYNLDSPLHGITVRIGLQQNGPGSSLKAENDHELSNLH